MFGYGKVILFGEHAVVYGYPALAAGLKKGIKCEIGEKRKHNFSIHVPSWNFKVTENDTDSLAKALKLILQNLPESSQCCELIIAPQIPSKAGLGSSAAVTVSIIKALLKFFNVKWELSKINELAFQAESVFHGTPSGIDNTVATYGNLCYVYDSNRFPLPQSAYKQLKLTKLDAGLLPSLSPPVSMVVINTQKPRKTKILVNHVRSLYTKKPDYYENIFQCIGSLAKKGYELLQKKDYEEFGQLMDLNHQYLKELEVSCPELEQCVKYAKDAGAIGAKLTGAGGGGCLLAFAPGMEEDVVKYFDKKGIQSFIAEIS